MSESSSGFEADIERLQGENEALRRENLALRQFIDSMQNIVEAVEEPRDDAEVMELLSQVLANALQTIDAKDGSLLVLDEDTEELVFVLTQGDIPQQTLAWRRLPPDKGVAGWVARHQRATVVNDVDADQRFYSELDEQLQFSTKSILAAPIIGGGRTLGVIEVLNKHDGRLFSSDDQALLTLICRFAGELLFSMMERHRLESTAVA